MTEFNANAAIIFPKLVSGISISKLFDANILQKVLPLFEKVRISKKSISDIIDLALSKKAVTKYKLKLSYLQSEKEGSYLLSLDKFIERDSSGEAVRFRSFNFDEQKRSYPEEVSKILETVEVSYPFTIIGKDQFQKEIDKSGLYFWMLDEDNQFIVVNNKFSTTLGLKQGQIEGKSLFNFVPSYLSDFYNSLITLVKNSLKSIEIEGLLIQPTLSTEDYKTVFVPLIDLDNQVKAIIFFGLSGEIGLNSGGSGSLINTTKLPFPVIMADEEGKIVEVSDDFRNLFSTQPGAKNQDKLSDYFESEFLENFYKVAEGKTTGNEFYITRVQSDQGVEGKFRVSVLKCGIRFMNKETFLLIFKNESAKDEFAEIFKTRGKMFDIIIRKNPEPIFVYTLDDLRFVEVNEAAEQLYGYSRDEFLRMDLTDLYSPEDIQSLLVDSPKKQKNTSFQGPFKHKKRNGSIVFVEIFKDSFVYEGKAAHFLIIRNISEKFESEKSLSFYKSVFENTKESVFLIDSSGFISFANDSAAKFLLLSKDKLSGSSIISYLKDEDRVKFNSHIIKKTSGQNSLYVTFIKNNGEEEEADVLLYSLIGENNEVDSYAVLVNPLKKTDSVSIKSNQNVLTETPKVLNQESLSSIFHEILTPINVIIGFVQELKDSFDSPNTDQIEAMNFIAQNRVNLLDTMNAISEYSNLMSKQFEVHADMINVFEMIELLEKDLADDNILKTKKLLLKKASKSFEIKTDKKLLKDFIFGLLKLISRISPAEELYISYYQYDNSSMIMTFRDGDEISEKMQKILENVLLENSSIILNTYGMSKYSALTIQKMGELLSLQYDLIKKLGKDFEFGVLIPLELTTGNSEETVERTLQSRKKFKNFLEIEAEDREGLQERGTGSQQKSGGDDREEFIPILKTREKESNQKLDLSKLRCLYLEDQLDSQILFKVQMKELKEIEFAVGFEDAEPYLIPGKFDFIIMDINLHGEYNGLDAFKMVRRTRGFERIPIIAVSAYILPGDKDNFIQAGFTDFISKPLFRDKILESLGKIF
ncbi:MAG: PAS domain S-box protein [Ignavibacteriaceae bacterium]